MPGVGSWGAGEGEGEGVCVSLRVPTGWGWEAARSRLQLLAPLERQSKEEASEEGGPSLGCRVGTRQAG